MRPRPSAPVRDPFSDALCALPFGQSLEIPAVSQIRVSDDYQPSPSSDQWSLGETSLLAHVLGLRPFKDVFWTAKDQPGSKVRA
jgi:hypothetical protein